MKLNPPNTMPTPNHTPSTPPDLRSPLAKARDAYLETADCNAGTLRGDHANYYLQNRLQAAFLAGAEAQKQIQRAPSPVNAALLEALQELIPAQDDFDSCAGRLEGEQMNESGPTAKTRAYFREAKTRLLKARDAARDAEARAAEATK